MIDIHNIKWECLENVRDAFEIALVNRAYPPFADHGPSLKLGPGSEKENMLDLPKRFQMHLQHLPGIAMVYCGYL